MSNLKKIQKNIKGNPDIFDKVLYGLDSYASIKKEEIPSFDEVYGDILNNHIESVNKNEKSQKHTSFFLKKAFYVPACICIVLAVFFFTPAGKAFAEDIYRTVVQWFDSGVNVQHGKGEVMAETDEPGSILFVSIQDVRSETNQKIAWNKDNNLKDRISLTYYGAELKIISNYLTQKDEEITITQCIMTEGETEWAATISSDGGTAVDIAMPDGSHFIGYANGNYCYAINYQNNRSIEVSSEESDYDSFIEFIKGILVE